MNILWLSWRDIKNPEAGGAEKVTFEIARRLVKDNASVTLFTSRYKNSKPQENLQGLKIIRRGNRLTCRLHAFLHYQSNKKNYDLVIDEINTIPFLTPLYVKKKSICIVHQLAREYWWSETFFPLNLIGYFLEPFYLKLYRKTPTMAISKSTHHDLGNLGFRKVSIIRAGLDIKPKIISQKKNLVLFIGRLTKSKRPQDALLAFKIINETLPNSELAVIGTGKPQYLSYLKSQSKKLSLGSKISFLGFASLKEKINWLKKAKIILIPSIREGWGLVATEASALGCVPVAYNVPGLRDSVKHGKTGILTETNPHALAKEVIRILQNESLRKKLAQNGYLWSRQFAWENCYQDFKHIIHSQFTDQSL